MTTPSIIERAARALEPQAWAALGLGDTLAYKNRRVSSMRKARAVLEAIREPTLEMETAGEIPGWDDSVTFGLSKQVWQAMISAALNQGQE